jgi:membrane associated rhomboid family serine protease
MSGNSTGNSNDMSSYTTSYSKTLISKETISVITSTFTHASLLHISFNTLTTYSMLPLERQTGSYTFLSLVVFLIPLTALLSLLLTHLAHSLKHHKLPWRTTIKAVAESAQGQQTSLGYSSVLFAMITLLTLNSRSYAPLPFLKDLEFTTHHLTNGIKFNAAPLCLLLVTQVIMKQASFVGHLSGILSGYIVGCIDYDANVMFDPMIVVPVLVLANCFYKGYISLPWFLSKKYSTLTSKSSKIMRAILYIQWLLTIILLYYKHVDYSTAVTQKVIWFHLLLYFKGEYCDGVSGARGEDNRMRVLEGFITTNIIMIVFDVVLLGVVIALRDLLYTIHGLDIVLSTTLCLLKIVINTISVVASCFIIVDHDVYDDKDSYGIANYIVSIFKVTHGYGYSNLITRETEMVAFTGRGQVLGGSVEEDVRVIEI